MLEEGMALLEITNLEKTYPTGDQALKGVDISVDGGEILAILGLSGSGKTTLLRCINRLVEPDRGEIRFNGWDMTRLGPGALRRARREIGMVFQEFNLVDRLTVLENILCGLLGFMSTWRVVLRRFSGNDIGKAVVACQNVGLLEHMEKRVDQLSGGQRQRVGIARALAQKPNILLVDEPTSSLDPKNSKEIMELLVSLAKDLGIPMIVTLHNPEIAKRYADRIVGIANGLKVLDAEAASVDQDSLNRIYGESVGKYPNSANE